jgi:hypothetical protein
LRRFARKHHSASSSIPTGAGADRSPESRRRSMPLPCVA